MEVIAESETDYAKILAEGFNVMHNKLTCIKTFEPNANLAFDDGLAVYKNDIG